MLSSGEDKSGPGAQKGGSGSSMLPRVKEREVAQATLVVSSDLDRV